MRRERQNKVHEGMERKEETQESEGEKDYFGSCCTFVQTFGEQQHILTCFSTTSCSVVFSFYFKVSDAVEDQNHLPSSPGNNTSHTVCFSEQTDPAGSNAAD